MSWSPSDMPDLTGTTAVVTGANSGIGYYTALELARHGADVVVAARNTDKGNAAVESIRKELDDNAGLVRLEQLDLGSLTSIASFAERWTGALDLLVNNAGVMTPPRYRETEDGFELQFGTNHLGHYALTGRLLPALLSAPKPRVVTVSSLAHGEGRESVLDGNPREGYSPQRAYGNSKLANLLFAAELQRRATAAGTPLLSVAAHPGVSHTNLVTSPDGLGAIPGVKYVAPLFLRLAFQSAKRGAEPTLLASTADEPFPYTGPQRLRESRGPAGSAKRSRLARDEDLAAKLWTTSEELTGVSFPL
jgi:NAD(P)-dependent dehydrogenase (short-subunit alcohol dehydrogenase family)